MTATELVGLPALIVWAVIFSTFFWMLGWVKLPERKKVEITAFEPLKHVSVPERRPFDWARDLNEKIPAEAGTSLTFVPGRATSKGDVQNVTRKNITPGGRRQPLICDLCTGKHPNEQCPRIDDLEAERYGWPR